jgi:uncharacterized protein YcfJ
MIMKKAVMCVVENEGAAQAIVGKLQQAGFANKDISVVMPDVQKARDFADANDTKAPEGAVAGASAGTVVGGALGLLAGIGALAIPGVGLFIAAGPILATLTGVAAGATVGGVAGGLVGLGIPEEEATAYEGKLRGGNVLVGVHTENRDEQLRAEEVYKTARAEDVFSIVEPTAPSSVRESQRLI